MKVFLTQKVDTKLSGNMFQDVYSGSQIWIFPIPGIPIPGVKAPDHGSGSATKN
jgi:hypothetical protein